MQKRSVFLQKRSFLNIKSGTDENLSPQVADKVNVGSYFSMEKAMKIW